MLHRCWGFSVHFTVHVLRWRRRCPHSKGQYRVQENSGDRTHESLTARVSKFDASASTFFVCLILQRLHRQAWAAIRLNGWSSAFVAGDALVLLLVLLMPMLLLLLLLLLLVQRKRATYFGVCHMLAEFMLKHGTGDIGRFVNKMGASAAVSVTTQLSAGFRKISMCARCLHSSHVLTLRSATAPWGLRWESAHKDAMLRNLDSPQLDCSLPR